VTIVGLATVPASSTLIKNTETLVNLIIVIGAESIPLDGINVSSFGSKIYNLSDTSGLFQGKVEGDKLTWTLAVVSITETFSGIKK
jgi:hypothetical protein